MIPSPLHDTVVETIRSAARKLTGSARRAFQSEACHDYCNRSARTAERIFGWSRHTVQKGLDEQATGTIIPDQERSGRPSYSVQLPTLQDDIRSLVDPNTCTHPTFENTFRYTRMTGKAVLEALVREKGYKKSDLPAESTMRRLLGEMGYRLRRVQKTKPQKRFPRPKRFSIT
jgi:transposase